MWFFILFPFFSCIHIDYTFLFLFFFLFLSCFFSSTQCVLWLLSPFIFLSSSLALSFSFSLFHTLTLSHTHYRRRTELEFKAMMLEMAVAKFKACFTQEKIFWREGAVWCTLKGAEFKACISLFFFFFFLFFFFKVQIQREVGNCEKRFDHGS